MVGHSKSAEHPDDDKEPTHGVREQTVLQSDRQQYQQQTEHVMPGPSQIHRSSSLSSRVSYYSSNGKQDTELSLEGAINKSTIHLRTHNKRSSRPKAKSKTKRPPKSIVKKKSTKNNTRTRTIAKKRPRSRSTSLSSCSSEDGGRRNRICPKCGHTCCKRRRYKSPESERSEVHSRSSSNSHLERKRRGSPQCYRKTAKKSIKRRHSNKRISGKESSNPTVTPTPGTSSSVPERSGKERKSTKKPTTTPTTGSSSSVPERPNSEQRTTNTAYSIKTQIHVTKNSEQERPVENENPEADFEITLEMIVEAIETCSRMHAIVSTEKIASCIMANHNFECEPEAFMNELKEKLEIAADVGAIAKVTTMLGPAWTADKDRLLDSEFQNDVTKFRKIYLEKTLKPPRGESKKSPLFKKFKQSKRPPKRGGNIYR